MFTSNLQGAGPTCQIEVLKTGRSVLSVQQRQRQYEQQWQHKWWPELIRAIPNRGNSATVRGSNPKCSASHVCETVIESTWVALRPRFVSSHSLFASSVARAPYPALYERLVEYGWKDTVGDRRFIILCDTKTLIEVSNRLRPTSDYSHSGRQRRRRRGRRARGRRRPRGPSRGRYIYIYIYMIIYIYVIYVYIYIYIYINTHITTPI